MKHAFHPFVFLMFAVAGLHAAEPQAPAADPADPLVKARELQARAREHFDGNFKGAFASYHTDGIDAALACHRQILAIENLPGAPRVEALRAIADCHFERMEVDKANEALAKAANLQGLDAEDRWTARKNQAVGFQRQLDYAAALAIYESLWAEDLHVHKRRDLEGRMTACLVELGRAREVLPRMTAWKRDPIDVARFQLNSLEDAAAAHTLAEGVLADGVADFGARTAAAELLLLIRAMAGDVKGLMAEADRLVPGLVKENPKANAIYRNLRNHGFTQFGVQNDPAFTPWLSARILAIPELPLGDFVKQSEARYAVAVRQRDLAVARAVAEDLLAREGVGDAVKRKYTLARAALDAGANPRAAVDRAERALDALGVDKADAPARAAGLLEAARLALSLGFDASAKALHEAREKMRVREPLRSIACTFVENGPADISEFLASPYFKDARNRARLDRKYGDNLQFLLETDSALTGRKVTEVTADFKPTEFVATCDADGVKLFFYAPSDKAKAIADGLATLGGYELYLATGPDAPYHCYLLHQVPGEMFDAFVTQYDNPGFRRARQKTGGVSVQHRVLKDGVATLLSFSWAPFFNQIPLEGDAWSFEALHWEQGGHSWGGSRSVHNRSSFGSLVFANLTEANRRAIKRRLIPVAAAAYRRELSSSNGFVEIWEDPELGDRDFHAAAIKPLRESLDGYLEQVKPAMADADVDQLFEKAVPQWMNIKYVVADLRRDALAQRRISGR